MGFFRHSLRLTAACLALALVSCIDGHEEVWVNADGSGRADIRYSLPAAAARFQGGETGVSRMLERFLKSTPAIKSSSHEVMTNGDRLEVRVRASFDSVLDLREISSGASSGALPPSATELAGKVEVKVDGLTVDFLRTVSPGKALPGAGFMPASQFRDRLLTYILHLPVVPRESNATRTADGGRTLIWEKPLAAALDEPIRMSFEARAPIPWWAKAAAIATASLLAALGWFLLRRRFNTRR